MDEKGGFSFINFGKTPSQEYEISVEDADREARRRASITAARKDRETLSTQEKKKNIEVSDVIIERNTSGSMQGTLYLKMPGTDTGFSLTWSVEDLPGKGTEVLLHPAHDDEQGIMMKFIEHFKGEITQELVKELPLY